MMSPLICMLVTTLPFFSSGCDSNTVKVYQVTSSDSLVAQSPPPVSQSANLNAEVAPAPGGPAVSPLNYVLPANWKETTPGDMRAASFLVANPNGRPGDVGVIPMPAAMGQLQLVNMWREQLSLPDISTQDASAAATTLKIDGNPAQMYDLVSTAKLVDGKAKARILVAMTTVGGMNWFFKMVGEDTFVETQKQAFLAFLNSVTFGGLPAPSTMDLSRLPASHPAIPGMMPGGAGLPASSAEDANKPTWAVPDGWTPAPGTQFSVAKYEAKGNGGAPADITVTSFGGDGGGLLPNANRWRGLLGLPSVTQPELDKLVSKISVNGVEGSLVDFAGSDLASGDSARMIVVVVPFGGQTWFYKITGDANTVAQQKDTFLKFVASAKYPDAN